VAIPVTSVENLTRVSRLATSAESKNGLERRRCIVWRVSHLPSLTSAGSAADNTARVARSTTDLNTILNVLVMVDIWCLVANVSGRIATKLKEKG
jgi:hypothetical protein